MYRTLVTFDIDGTLLNKNPSPKKIPVKEMILKELFGIDQEPSKILGYSTIGYTDIYTAEEVIKKITNTTKAPQDLIDKYFDLYGKFYEKYFNDNDSLSIIDGVERFLSRLNNEENLYLGIVSGNNKAVGNIKINLTNIGRFFDKNLIGLGTHRNRKDIILNIINNATNIYGKIDRVIHVGDAEQDIEAADEAGVESLLVKTGPLSNKPMNRTATLTIDNFEKDYQKAIDFILNPDKNADNYYNHSL